jgi:microcystin-dependent protein
VDYPKSVPSVGLKDGKFIDENPVTGQVGSLISSEWGNAVTDELLNVIRAGGEEPAEAEHDQLLAAIKAIVKDNIPPEQVRTTLAQYGITDAYTKSVTYTKAEIEALLKNMSALPVGAMVPFPKGTVPAGFLEVDGSVQSAATYPDLAAYLGTTFNTGGEAAGVFRLPESRGEFLRGWDNGRGVDAGRAIGSLQAAEMAAHSHYNSLRASAEGNILALTVFGAPSSVGSSRVFQTSTGNYADAGNYPVSTTGGAETRPRNLAVMWCIKAWNAPINQGNIDIAALAASIEVAMPERYFSGFGLSLNTTKPSTTIDVAPGSARVTGNPVRLSAAISGVLQSAGVWSPGTNGNKLDRDVRVANTWYHVFVIRQITSGSADLLFSVSINAPAVPTGYEVIRRIASIKTDSTGEIVPFINMGRKFWFVTPIRDAYATGVAALSSLTVSISVPAGLRVLATMHVAASANGAFAYTRPTDAAEVAMAYNGVAQPFWLAGVGCNTYDSFESTASEVNTLTDINGRVVVQLGTSNSTTYGLTTLGYEELE